MGGVVAQDRQRKKPRTMQPILHRYKFHATSISNAQPNQRRTVGDGNHYTAIFDSMLNVNQVGSVEAANAACQCATTVASNGLDAARASRPAMSVLSSLRKTIDSISNSIGE
jgi:hypothetical protein